MSQANNPDKSPAVALDVADLAGVIYSSGKVFDGLRTGRLDTENFLRSGSLEGISSRSDLALLQDLRDVAQCIIDSRATPIDTTYVREVNARITRSGALHPGQYRTDAQQIGVSTPFGRHEPPPVSDTDLNEILDTAMAQPGPRAQALDLFVEIAKAQPFEDGNKRTALFVANSVLIREPEPEMLVIPVGENSVDDASRFNELLARAYVLGENEGIKNLLRSEGLGSVRERQKAALFRRNPELRDIELDRYGVSGDGSPTQQGDTQLG